MDNICTWNSDESSIQVSSIQNQIPLNANCFEAFENGETFYDYCPGTKFQFFQFFHFFDKDIQTRHISKRDTHPNETHISMYPNETHIQTRHTWKLNTYPNET